MRWRSCVVLSQSVLVNWNNAGPINLYCNFTIRIKQIKLIAFKMHASSSD